MKKTFVALAFLVLMTLVFTGCGDKATIFVGQNGIWTYTYIFNTDGTWVGHMKGTNEGVTFDLDIMAGTYTGDPKKDGYLSLKLTKMVNLYSIMAAALQNPSITSVTNETAALVSLPENEQETGTITILGGSFTASNGIVYTRR
ncbi:MAG: hypothetical protein J5647_13495 [Spirochaetaceae bacterium]|nr:hypothetical protein [Spirochaetaceae bacterium]